MADKGHHQDDPTGYILVLWGLACVGLAALPVGFFTACIGTVHLLVNQKKESTLLRCMRFVFPKSWPIYLLSVFEIYSDYLFETNQEIKAPPQNSWSLKNTGFLALPIYQCSPFKSVSALRKTSTALVRAFSFRR